VAKYKSGDTVRLKTAKASKGMVADVITKPEGDIYLVRWTKNKGPKVDGVRAVQTWEAERALEMAR